MKKAVDAQGMADQEDPKYHLILSKLTERIKELNCLYGISRLVETASSVDEILSGAITLIPKAWQYPAITHARIRLKDKEYASEGFMESKWKQSEVIRVDGEESGKIEVFYGAKRPDRDEGPFMLEERHLIHAIAERLGHSVARVEAGADDYITKPFNYMTLLSRVRAVYRRSNMMPGQAVRALLSVHA